MEMSLQESQDLSSSSVSDIVGREAIPPSCYCKMGNSSSDSSMPSVSSNDSSNLSYLPIFPEGTTWKFRSRSLPAFSRKEPSTSTPRSQGSSLPTFQLSPLVRGELEGHICQKVSTLRAQVVPLPVKKSWEILNNLMDVQGVPEQGLPKTQLPKLIPQSAEQNTNRSPDVPSFHVHVNIGVNSELRRTEVAQPLTSNKQLQAENDRQVLRYNPLVISMGTPSPINIVQEENTVLKKDPKHVLELNIDQRVLGLPEERIQPQRAQVTEVELTAQVPCSAKDSVKVTPEALLQVMGLMGMISESHAQVKDDMGFPPQPSNQAETASITPGPSDQVIEPKIVKSLPHPATESKSMASRLSQVTDNMKVTPVTLLHIMDSMGMVNELHPHVVEPAGIAPKPEYQVMESAKVDTLHGHQAIRPGDRSLGLQQSVLGTVEVIPQPQHKVMGTPNMTLGSQNQAIKHIGITPGPTHENILEISSSELPKAIDYTKATPVAQQTMDSMQIIPPGQPHVTEPRALIQTQNLTPLPAQPDVLTSTVPIQDLKTVGLARDTHVQDVKAMGLKLEPKKQEESPVTFVPGVQFQDEFMEVLQGPQLQGIKPKELTSQSQMQDRKHVIISYLKPQSLKPVNIAKTQGIPGEKIVNLVSTQQCRGMTPTDLTPKPGQDDQKTVRSPERKGGILDQLSKHFQSEDVLSMKSGQEAKPADKKPKEIKFKVQFKDIPSFELTPEPVVHSVKPEEVQDESQVPSMKPCQVTPEPQGHQVKVSEPTLEPPFQDVKTMVLTEPQIGSTKSVQ